MTFLEIRQRIAEQIGVDSSDTTSDNNATMVNKLKEWVNSRYRALASKRSWNWAIKDIILQTTTEITTGTVSITANSTSITFSSGPAVSVATWFIQFEGSEDWYQISAHTAAATSATLANAWLGSNNTLATYTLRKVYYTLPSDTAKILDMRQTRDDIPLRYVAPRQLDQYVPDRTRSGEPEFYTISGVDSSRLYKVEFYPVPNVAMNINCRYYQVVAEMSGDSDVPIIPEAYHDILVWDVLGTYGFMFMDDTRISAAKALANELFKDMVKNDIATENIVTRRPFDVDLTNADIQLGRLDLPIA